MTAGQRSDLTRSGSTSPITRALPRGIAAPPAGPRQPARPVGPLPLVRRLLGDVLRRTRQRQGRTLRQVSAGAMVSLGYLSEVERGQKEASSELLASICAALDVPQSAVLREVAADLAAAEGVPSIATPPAPGGVVAAA